MTLTPAEVAARLQVSVETVTGMLRAGTLPGFRVGRLWRIPEAALEDWMRLAATGLRVGEAMGLAWEDAEQEAGGGCRREGDRMSERDRLAADLHDRNDHLGPVCDGCNAMADHLIALGWTRQEACDPPCGDCCVEHPHWTHYHIVTDPGAAQMAEWLAAWEKGSNSVRATDLHGLVTDPAWAEGHRRGEPLDQERLARALHEARINCWTDREDVCVAAHDEAAAAIAKAYREDSDAHD